MPILTVLGSANYAIAAGWDVSAATSAWYILDGDRTKHWFQPYPEITPLDPVDQTGSGDPIYLTGDGGQFVHAGRLFWPPPPDGFGLPATVLRDLQTLLPAGGKACIKMLDLAQAATARAFSYTRWNVRCQRVAGLARIPGQGSYAAEMKITWAVQL